MGMVLQRGYEDQRRLLSKSDEGDESERRLESLGVMELEKRILEILGRGYHNSIL